MRHDVIPLACGDWCILAASSALAGGGGVGMGGRGGEGVNFPQIETSKCERSPAWSQFRAQANTLHTCSTVLFLVSRLPTVGQFWCFKGVHKQGIVVMVFESNGLMETQQGEKARLWLCTSTPSSLWVLLHIKAEGRREGVERWKGLLWVEE